MLLRFIKGLFKINNYLVILLDLCSNDFANLLISKLAKLRPSSSFIDYSGTSKQDVSLCSNLNSGDFVIQFHSFINEKIKIVVTDETGSNVFQKSYSLNENKQVINISNTSLANGIYTVSIIGKDTIQTKKMIKRD